MTTNTCCRCYRERSARKLVSSEVNAPGEPSGAVTLSPFVARG
jgi:hypothetical protein